MDIVYPLQSRTGSQTDEFKYSLRSLQNVEYDRVWVLTRKLPRWIRNVEWVKAWDQSNDRFRNTTAKLQLAAETPDISEDFQWWNDDFYALNPTSTPVWHNGTLKKEPNPRILWKRYRNQTRKLLDDWNLPAVNYELHVPIVFNKTKLKEMFARLDADVLPRSVYGNLYEIGGVEHADPKVVEHNDPMPEGDWVSTHSRSWNHGIVGEELRKRFPEPSCFEEAP